VPAVSGQEGILLSGDHGVDCLLQRTGLGRRGRRLLPGLLELGSKSLQPFTAEPGASLRNQSRSSSSM
jgi:hypothetical protein